MLIKFQSKIISLENFSRIEKEDSFITIYYKETFSDGENTDFVFQVIGVEDCEACDEARIFCEKQDWDWKEIGYIASGVAFKVYEYIWENLKTGNDFIEISDELLSKFYKEELEKTEKDYEKYGDD